ncbi:MULTISPECIES: septal ring lytic transglycosylase RlpA family protein [Variovorax]|uniref:septal ring lytic transglycosylase RlpA family protein n=1 Tax=Variovorax TaxID=34072 RepID=UPI0028600A84|nr:septal ring lytic transglycosylase RlpA family protein [Variovorax sp. 3319]MDR6890376.1 rare lipoprotein A [Variovorax sp. 3319]
MIAPDLVQRKEGSVSRRKPLLFLSVAGLCGVLGACAQLHPEGASDQAHAALAGQNSRGVVANVIVSSSQDTEPYIAPLPEEAVPPRADVQRAVKSGTAQRGIASWYGRAFHGRRTANGEVFNMNELTAAHRTLPLGSYARISTSSGGQKSVVVRINDRGPFIRNRIIDLSYAAALSLGLQRIGTMQVEVVALEPAKARVVR